MPFNQKLQKFNAKINRTDRQGLECVRHPAEQRRL